MSRCVIFFLVVLTISPVFCPPAVSQYSEEFLAVTAETTTATDITNALVETLSPVGNREVTVVPAAINQTKPNQTTQTSDSRACTILNGRKGFRCDSGQCINDGRVCDGGKWGDCDDKEDETPSLCGHQTHDNNITTCNYRRKYNGFVCDRGQCIYDRNVCDGGEFGGCEDKSDDTPSVCGLTCPHDHNMTTTALSIARGDCRYCWGGERWRCNDGTQCIYKDKVCDGKADCKDKSDEMEDRGCITCLPLTDYTFQMPLRTSLTNETDDFCNPTWFKHDWFPRPPNKNRVFCPNKIATIGLYQLCNGQTDCPSGIDEYNCPWFVNVFFQNSYKLGFIALGMVTMVALLWLMLYKMEVAKPDFTNTSTKIRGNMTIIGEFLKEVFALINSSGDLSRSTTLRKKYRKIRESGNSLKILIESLSHTFIEPKSCHEISKFIMSLEKPFQRNKRKRCLVFFRKHLGSNSETEKFISFLDEPGCLQELKYKLTNFCDNVNTNSYAGSVLKIVSVVLVSAFFFFDILKDISLYLLLQQYLSNNTSSAPIETFLVHMSLGCLVLSHTVIGIQCLLNWPKMFPSTADYSPCKRGFIFFVLLILSPLLPTIVAMHGVLVSFDKDMFISQYRKNPKNMDISTLLNKIEMYDSYLSVNAKNHAYVRIIESMLEASPQVLVIVLLAIWQSANGSVNGVIDLLVQSENRNSLILFALSVPSSVITIMLSILKFTNTFKQGSIGLKASVIICVGYFLLFVSKICSLMTFLSPCYIMYNSITQQNIIQRQRSDYNKINVLNVTNLHIPSSPLLPNYSWVPHFLHYSLLSLIHPFLPIALPVILFFLLSHVVFVFVYCYKNVPDFQTVPVLDRVFHCLANLLVPIPFHSFTEMPQRRRWKEYRAYVLSSLTTSVLIFMGSVLARQSTPFRGIEHDTYYGRALQSNASYLPVLNTTLHYQSANNAGNKFSFLVPYAHPHIYIFTLLYNYHEPVARFLNLIFHLPWLLLVFFLHGLGVFVLSYYYRTAHLWSSLNSSQHTAEELLELIEEGNHTDDEGKYEDDEEEDEDEGSCLTLMNCFSHCKERLKKTGETICSRCSPKGCQCGCRCHPKLGDCISSVFRCRRCIDRGNQEDVEVMVEKMALEAMPMERENSIMEKEETAEEICSKIVEEIITSSLFRTPKSIGISEEEKVEIEVHPTVNSRERCQCSCRCHPKLKNCMSSVFWCKSCIGQGNQEVVEEMALVEREDFIMKKEETAEEICSKIVADIITSSFSKPKSLGNPEEEKVEIEVSSTVNSTVRVDVHQEQEEF